MLFYERSLKAVIGDHIARPKFAFDCLEDFVLYCKFLDVQWIHIVNDKLLLSPYFVLPFPMFVYSSVHPFNKTFSFLMYCS
jgi:hypothetical protein